MEISGHRYINVDGLFGLRGFFIRSWFIRTHLVKCACWRGVNKLESRYIS